MSGQPSGWTVRQGGNHALWDRIEPAVTAWREAGEPPLTEFRITITPGGQAVSFDPEHSWDLPTDRGDGTTRPR